MGYGTRPNRLGGDIRTFWPDDTDTEMYIDTSSTPVMADILQKIYEKWPDASLINITMEAREIHTDCLGYDMYDPTDYTNFFIITRLPGA